MIHNVGQCIGRGKSNAVDTFMHTGKQGCAAGGAGGFRNMRVGETYILRQQPIHTGGVHPGVPIPPKQLSLRSSVSRKMILGRSLAAAQKAPIKTAPKTVGIKVLRTHFKTDREQLETPCQPDVWVRQTHVKEHTWHRSWKPCSSSVIDCTEMQH